MQAIGVKGRDVTKVLLTAVIVLGAILPFLMANPYYLHVIIMGLILTLPILGLTLFMGYAGQLSLGHEALYGLGAYSAGIAIKNGLPFPVALLVAAIVPYYVAKLLGIATLKQVKGIYLVPVTLGFSLFMNVLFTNLVELTGGSSGLTGISRPQFFMEENHYYYLCLGIVILTYFAISRLINSRIGIALRSIAGNSLAAECIGIDIYRYKTFALALSGLLAGLGGGLYASYANYICPVDFGMDMNIRFVCMAIIGGLGNIYGACMGAVMLNVVPELLRASEKFQMSLYGLVLIITLIYWPRGLGGLLDYLPKRGKPDEERGKPDEERCK